MTDVLTIGVYVTTLRPAAPAQARFQDSLFAGLRRLADKRFHFAIFTHQGVEHAPALDGFSFHTVQRAGPWAELVAGLRRGLGGSFLAVRRLFGADGGRLNDLVQRWMRAEPAHYDQLREMNVRLLWNMNQHELSSPVPFIRTIWDLNHRIHSLYPEFSHTRFTFDGLDRGLAESVARASYVVVGTEEGRQQVTDLLCASPAKVRVIPFPTPLLPAPSGDPHAAEGRYVFYPARFWPHKNHYVILAALKRLRETHGVALRCVLSGQDEGNLEHVLRSAERLGVRDLVDYRGLVSEQALVDLYAGAEALVYASAVGPDNLPPLEAMSLGCPVITAEVPGAHEQFGDAALFFPPTDDERLAEQIAALLGSKRLRASLIARGKARAARFTVDDYAQAIVAVLEEFSAAARAWERCDSAFT